MKVFGGCINGVAEDYACKGGYKSHVCKDECDGPISAIGPVDWISLVILAVEEDDMRSPIV